MISPDCSLCSHYYYIELCPAFLTFEGQNESRQTERCDQWHSTVDAEAIRRWRERVLIWRTSFEREWERDKEVRLDHDKVELRWCFFVWLAGSNFNFIFKTKRKEKSDPFFLVTVRSTRLQKWCRTRGTLAIHPSKDQVRSCFELAWLSCSILT